MNEPEAPVPSVRPERKATLRIGQNGLNVILIVVILFIALPLLFIGYRVYLNFKAKRDITIAESNLHGLYQALFHYSLDWDGKLPPAAVWTNDAAGYLPSASGIAGGKMACLQGPSDGENVRYEYNDLAAGYDTQEESNRKVDPRDLVLLIERPGAQDNAHVAIPRQGNAQAESALFKLLTFPHYSDDPDNATTVILYASGTVSVRTRKDFRAD
jgi:hypothetical protein